MGFLFLQFGKINHLELRETVPEKELVYYTTHNMITIRTIYSIYAVL